MNELLTPAIWAGGGAGLTLFIIALVALLRRKTAQRRNARRDRIITSVQEKWTDVDSILVSYRTGKISADAFRNALSEKVEVINRTYKPGVHLLDIFFVKYTEKLIEEYNRVIETGVVEASQRETVSVSISPVREIFGKAVKAAAREEDATLVSATAIPLPVNTPETILHPSEDVVASAIEEVAKEEKDVPLESFIEMDAGAGERAGMAATTAVVDEPKEEKEEDAKEVDKEEDKEKDIEEEKGEAASAHEPAVEKVVSGTLPPAAVEQAYPEETLATESGSQFSLADKVSACAPPISIDAVTKPEGEDEKVMAEAAVSFPVKLPGVQKSDSSQQDTFQQPPPASEIGREETIQQQTAIDDVEAETIIADRNELLGVGKEAEQKTLTDRNQIGITGDDVSDMLDQFFGGKK